MHEDKCFLFYSWALKSQVFIPSLKIRKKIFVTSYNFLENICKKNHRLKHVTLYGGKLSVRIFFPQRMKNLRAKIKAVKSCWSFKFITTCFILWMRKRIEQLCSIDILRKLDFLHLNIFIDILLKVEHYFGTLKFNDFYYLFI